MEMALRATEIVGKHHNPFVSGMAGLVGTGIKAKKIYDAHNTIREIKRPQTRVQVLAKTNYDDILDRHIRKQEFERWLKMTSLPLSDIPKMDDNNGGKEVKGIKNEVLEQYKKRLDMLIAISDALTQGEAKKGPSRDDE